MEKHQKAAQDARELQNFHKSQMSEVRQRKEEQKKEERAYKDHNMKLLKVEEEQFQEYAERVIGEAEKRGAHTQPLRKAAKTGAGMVLLGRCKFTKIASFLGSSYSYPDMWTILVELHVYIQI